MVQILEKIINYLFMLQAIQNNSSFTTLRTTTDSMITTGNDSLSEPTTSIPINATSDVGINQTDPSTPITEVKRAKKYLFNPGWGISLSSQDNENIRPNALENHQLPFYVTGHHKRLDDHWQ